MLLAGKTLASQLEAAQAQVSLVEHERSALAHSVELANARYVQVEREVASLQTEMKREG